MDNAESEFLALTESVSLEAHRPDWLEAFESERQRITRALPGAFIDIRHIGSTAVPGLIAKPVIDLIAGLGDFSTLDKVINELIEIGYVYQPFAIAQSDDRKWLFKHLNGRRTHHLHLAVYGSRAWVDRVDFCERLKADPSLRARYEELKVRLQAHSGDDREAYTAGKASFIQAALAGKS